MNIEKRLAELAIELPTPPTPLGNYVGAITVGNLVYVSGHGTAKADGSYVLGRVPTECSEELAYNAARLVGINVLATLKDHVGEGSNIAISVGDYFSTMLDQNMSWDDAAELRRNWGRKFCLKGVMSIDDARRAVDMGADAIMISNHGQLNVFYL